MNNDTFYGIGMILIGLFSLWFTREYPAQKPDIWRLDLQGYLGGISFNMIGLLLIVGYFSRQYY
jgi:hypothetical protein